MAAYFDPRFWSPLRAVDLGKRLIEPMRPEQWAAFTTAWLDPVADLGSGTVTALLPDVLMTVLSEGILGRFGGREVTATLLGYDLTATLRTLRARRRGAHFQTKTVLTDLRWNGHPIEEMTVVANGVRLIPGVPTKVRAAGLEITGTVATATLIEWLGDRVLDWRLAVRADGLLVARHRRRRIHALLDATIADNELRLAVHGVTWCGIRLPRRRLRVAPLPLTDLPNDLRIVRADRDGHHVRFRIDVPEVTGSFDLAQIRSAIVTGTTLIVF
ncbi:hypothetical protein IU500_11930 [Nocardia terpenica]|uniref:hypothetical protein n=1 Tax=Nocardia terpenica TaxID=455432 RepID=UPI001894E76C|nr:hypothetical protein [Nocardia terpenica]MBF6063114.1 hypothetical protein [Nocardia terpenica]MBF6104751.1 hypothetical protein [Nocardia terpenica]MBF6112813.1 hypothetical protein [Nocardia terpenica]MBF6118479.1 hypothetical protein [Nocardia terpenica]MBF6154958.1 hypothetical protein [Nocardia terpenica]